MTTPTPDAAPLVSPEDKTFWLERRRALLYELGAIERRLGLPPTIASTKAERERRRFEQRRGAEGEG